MQLVGGHDLLAAAVLRVVELPPPLLADGGDGHGPGTGLGVQVEDRADGRDRDHGQDQRRDERPADLERRAAVDLLGAFVVAGPRPVADGDEDDGADDQDADHGRQERDRVEQVADLLGDGALGPQRVLLVVGPLRTTAGEDERQGDQARERERRSAARAAMRHLLSSPTEFPDNPRLLWTTALRTTHCSDHWHCWWHCWLAGARCPPGEGLAPERVGTLTPANHKAATCGPRTSRALSCHDICSAWARGKPGLLSRDCRRTGADDDARGPVTASPAA